MDLNYETNIKLHPIQIREDKKNFIVEDQATGEFFEMPALCVQAIEMIENGTGLLEIERKLKALYPQEEINILEFSQQLIDLELIQEINGDTIEYTKKQKGKSGFLWIPQRVGKFFFNRFTFFAYSILFFIIVGIFIINPQAFPQYKDIFVFDIMVFNMLLFLVISFTLVSIHEFGHVLAMRSVGLPTKISIGHRLFLVVFETDMESVWSLDSRKRNVLYLAGICFDIVLLFLALILPIVIPDMPGIMKGIMGFIVFDIIIRLIYQCCIYMKTDFYYVFENMTGCYNLIENAQSYFKGIFFPNKSKLNQEIFAGEKPVVISYGIFYFLGIIFSFGLFVVYFIPQIIYIIRHSIPGLTMHNNPVYFWDSVVMLLQLIAGFIMLLYSWRKSYKLKYK